MSAWAHGLRLTGRMRRVLEAFDSVTSAAISLCLIVCTRLPVFAPVERAAQAAELTRTLNAQGASGGQYGGVPPLGSAGLKPRFSLGHSFAEVTALYAASTTRRSAIWLRRGPLDPIGRSAAELIAAAPTPPRWKAAWKDFPEGRRQRQRAAPDRSGRCKARSTPPKGGSRTWDWLFRLPVAAAFHTSCVDYARQPWTKALSRDITAPRLAVFANRPALYPDNPNAIRELLAEQPFRRPV